MKKEIRLVTARDMIEGVAEKWKRAYYSHQYNGWSRVGRQEDAGDMHDKLLMLDTATATAEDVEAIIGNAGWTACFCDVCCQEKAPCIKFASEGQDFHSIHICCDCIREAAAMAEEPAEAECPDGYCRDDYLCPICELRQEILSEIGDENPADYDVLGT